MLLSRKNTPEANGTCILWPTHGTAVYGLLIYTHYTTIETTNDTYKYPNVTAKCANVTCTKGLPLK